MKKILFLSAIALLFVAGCQKFAKKLPPDAPANPTPPMAATNVLIDSRLLWTPCSDPNGEGITYTVSYGLDSAQLSALPDQNNNYYKPDSLHPNTTYFWKVIAKNRFGQTSGPLWKFKTGNSNSTILYPSKPLNIYPADNSTDIYCKSLVLKWSVCTNAVGDPVTYDLYIDPVCSGLLNGTITGMPISLTTNSYALPELCRNTTFTWRVVAKVKHDTSGYYTESSSWKFTTKSAGTFTDPRDSNVYDTIHIGNQVWMAENLRYKLHVPTSSFGYPDGNPANETLYGLLYVNNPVPDSLIPGGWRIPTENDWNTLIQYLGGPLIAGYKMKDADSLFWSAGNNAKNCSGFAARGAGMYFGQTLPYGFRENAVFQISSATDLFYQISYNGSEIIRVNKNYPKTSIRLIHN